MWNFTTGGYVISGPAVFNGNVYFGSYDHNVYALDALTGTLKNGVSQQAASSNLRQSLQTTKFTSAVSTTKPMP